MFWKLEKVRTNGEYLQPWRITPPSRLSPVRLSPDFQDLSKRVRLSPAFFAYHFQDLTKQDLTEQDLIKLDLMINFKISKSLNHNQFKARPYRFKRVL